MTSLSKDSFAILLLCSDLAMPANADYKPFTLKEWQVISYKLKNSPLERPQSFFDSGPEDWRTHLQITSEQTVRMQKLLGRGGQLGIELERLESLGIWVTTRAEANYPMRLKQVLKQKSPVALFGAGDKGILGYGGVAIIGSRNVDPKGASFTECLAKKCAGENLTVISGGAKGVDSMAQIAAMQAGGKVIAVLAESLEARIMKRENREAIIAGKLLLISSFNPKAHFKVYTAMERNKYIYALSDYAVVVSSTADKGGTWTGATENLRAGWVPLFVRSGNGLPDGNRKLVGKGGIPLDSEILDRISLKVWFAAQAESLPKSISLFKEESESYTIFDSFERAWPHLEKALEHPRGYKELSELLNVSDDRIKKWLKQALDDGKVKKLTTRPVKFEVVSSKQKTIFDMDTPD